MASPIGQYSYRKAISLFRCMGKTVIRVRHDAHALMRHVMRNRKSKSKQTCFSCDL